MLRLYEPGDEPPEKIGQIIGSIFAIVIFAGIIAVGVSYVL
jgi:hypothetical protein